MPGLSITASAGGTTKTSGAVGPEPVLIRIAGPQTV